MRNKNYTFKAHKYMIKQTPNITNKYMSQYRMLGIYNYGFQKLAYKRLINKRVTKGHLQCNP